MSTLESTAPLLVELLCEELPPKALKRLSAAFAETLTAQLRAQRLIDESAAVTPFATPRRLAVIIDRVLGRAPDAPFTQKILPVGIAYDAGGRPTTPLLRKLAALDLSEADLPKLKRAPDGKSEALFYEGVTPGSALGEGLQKALASAIAALPIPKVMRYPKPGGYYNEVHFVRPVHRLVALHGAAVLPVTALGLTADRITEGHRFLAATPEIALQNAADYENVLQAQGKVIASFDQRRARIESALREAAVDGTEAAAPAALLDEVTALVEWPVVYRGRFDPAFLQVPQECLILTMQQNQKYFALTDANGRLVEHFLLVSNLETADPAAIIGGNERVLRARLADARFFFEQDCRKPLASRVEALAGVVYFKGLGSQKDRVERLERIAGKLAVLLGADANSARRIAHLAKADLVTDMVGEFPELQGTMGRYYAQHDGESAVVANGVEQHYWPRFAGDRLPETPEALCVAMADKLEVVAGMFATGNEPTGDKDPFGLRRAAIGVLRMMIERNLPFGLPSIIAVAVQAVEKDLSKSAATDPAAGNTKIEDFFYDRLRGMLKEDGHSTQAIEAVLAQRPDTIAVVPARLDAVRAFSTLLEAAALAAANKRIVNILKKSDATEIADEADPALFREEAERTLYAVFHERIDGAVEAAMQRNDFTGALQVLAGARSAVDRFFDEVMVMVDDAQVRANRLALLNGIRRTMNRVADIAMLAS